MVSRDRFNENFGGICSDTGEECVDLNQVDMSLEGNVPASVAGQIYRQEIPSAPYWTLATHFSNQGGMEPSEPWLENHSALEL